MNLLDKYSEEQLAELAENLASEVATRKRNREKAEAEQAARPKVSISVSLLEGCWRYGCRGDKVAMIHKYLFGGAEYYLGILTGKWGTAQVMLRWSMGTATEVNSIPDGAREVFSSYKKVAA